MRRCSRSPAKGWRAPRRCASEYLSHVPGVDLDALQNEIEALDAWNWEQRVEQTLYKLELDAAARIGELSGGLKEAGRAGTRAGGAARRAAARRGRPTTSISTRSAGWRNCCWRSRGSVVVISHDRAFLDRVTTRTVELDRGRLMSYAGNFSQYQVLKRSSSRRGGDQRQRPTSCSRRKRSGSARAWRHAARRRRRASSDSRCCGTSARNDAMPWAGSAWSQQRRARAASWWPSSRTRASGSARAGAQDGHQAFHAHHPARRQGRLIGPNGASKTTLLKLILGQLEADEGHGQARHALQVAYFDQMRDQLDLDATLEDTISPGSEWIEISSRRTHVKSYLGDSCSRPRARIMVRTLSGGERNRLLLARLFAATNVLVLDDRPTTSTSTRSNCSRACWPTLRGTVFLVSRPALPRQTWSRRSSSRAMERWREFEAAWDWLTQARRAGTQWPDRRGQPSWLPSAGTGRSLPEPASEAAPARPSCSCGGAEAQAQLRTSASSEALPGRIEALEQEQVAIDRELADSSLYASDPARPPPLWRRATADRGGADDGARAPGAARRAI